MKHTTRLLDILDRAENGPIIDESQWDVFIVPQEIAKLQTEFDINFKNFGDTIVPSDDALADRLFEAGLALAERIGVFCSSTSRRMLFSRDEILSAISVAPIEITYGEGLDKHTERKRKIEDTQHITIKGGGVGTIIPEHLYLSVLQSYVQEPLIDVMIDCTLETIYGREIRTRSPWEILVGWYEAETAKTACRRAGRPGLGIGCVENAVSEVSELSADGEGGFSKYDWHHIAMVSEFKTDYTALNKLTHLVNNGSIIHSFYNTIYGGSVGGKEGVAIAIVGGCILLQMIYMTNTHSVSPAHPFYGNDTGPELLLPISIAQQAMARNCRLMTDVVLTPVSGPGTHTLLYETAAMAMLATASGACGIIGPRSGAGVNPGHVSGLEARFMAEVSHASAGMTRKEANRLVNEMLNRYKSQLNQRPSGKAFDDVYDLRTLKPTTEWQKIYTDVKKELTDLGLVF
ncbi:MAG: monomethylamine:corrinoid methyltransferase [Flexilinea sp.]